MTPRQIKLWTAATLVLFVPTLVMADLRVVRLLLLLIVLPAAVLYGMAANEPPAATRKDRRR